MPDSLAVKCVPKHSITDEFVVDEYLHSHNDLSTSSHSDESDRQKADSGIETDEIEEAHNSHKLTENNKTEKCDDNLKSHNENSLTSHCSVESEKTECSSTGSFANFDDTSEALNEQHESRVRTKREGVIADSIDQKSTRDFDLDLKVYEKSEETENLIKSAIIANDFLNNMMDAERLQALVNAMIPQVLKENSYVIKEGETGNQFFVSAEGEYEVIKDGVCIKKFGAGVVFGELAILYKARRFASIKVTTDAFVWALDRKIFQKIMMKTGSQEREQNIKFLSSVRVLQGVSEEVLHKIGDLLKREFYATASTIIRQGDQGDKFYIIRGGSVTVTKRMNDGDVRIVGTLKRGDYFGEQALINRTTRMANIIANEPGTECLTLDRSLVFFL